MGSNNLNLDNVNLFKLRQLKVLDNLLFINVSEPTLNLYFNGKERILFDCNDNLSMYSSLNTIILRC
jgi:hypothetical protein